MAGWCERDELAGLKAFRTEAVSRLAVQHGEITRLRAQLAGGGNVRSLRAPAQ